MSITPEVIVKLDELVERADYGGPADDARLASAISDYWPEMEPILRSATGGATAHSARKHQRATRQ